MTDTRYRFELNFGSNGWITNSTVTTPEAQRIRDHHAEKEMPEGEWWRLSPVTPPEAQEKASTPEAPKKVTRARSPRTKKVTGETTPEKATTAKKATTRARSPRGGSNSAAKKVAAPEFKAAQ